METNEVPIRKTKLNKISTGSIGNRNEITRKYKLHPRNYIYIYTLYMQDISYDYKKIFFYKFEKS